MIGVETSLASELRSKLAENHRLGESFGAEYGSVG
jgi:hypothetical protein